MALSVPVAIMLLSLSGIPIAYLVNTASTLHGETGLLISGVVALSTLSLLTYLAIAGKNETNDPLFYVFTLCTFSSVVDFLIGLETDHLISGFMTNYLKDGEPYLGTPYGSMICYWDGTGHYLMYIIMLYLISQGRSFREVGLYWAGSIGHSMIVFIPGNIVGKFGIRPSFLLNVPYMFIPFMSCGRFLKERRAEAKIKTPGTSLLSRPLDLLLVLGLLTSVCVAFLRGFAVLGCKNDLFTSYVAVYEPYLNDPVAYPKIQMLVYLFYYVPYYLMAVYGLMSPGQSWMPDWALIHAGASVQGQFAHLFGAIHRNTEPEYRIPTSPDVRNVFYLINVGLLVLPHLLALRCVLSKSFFNSSKTSEQKTK